jgi:hypothetical protein
MSLELAMAQMLGNKERENLGYSRSVDHLTKGGLSMNAGWFRNCPTHLTDYNGGCFRTDLVIKRPLTGEDGLLLLDEKGVPLDDETWKILYWHAPDPITDPHKHPWPGGFDSYIIYGEYEEVRSELDSNGKVKESIHTYKEGDINHFPGDAFHVVTKVRRGTVTLLVAKGLTPGNEWGYLKGGKYEKAESSLAYLGALRDLNPHMRK